MLLLLPWLMSGCSLLMPLENAELAQRMVTHATAVNIVRIPEMNHFLPRTRSAHVKAVILGHLQ